MSEVVIPPEARDGGPPVPVRCVVLGGLEHARLSPAARAGAELAGFDGQAGRVLLTPGGDGEAREALFGLGAPARDGRIDLMVVRGLPAQLPPGDYALEGAPDPWDPTQTAIAFALGAYVYDRYKAHAPHGRARLIASPGADLAEARRVGRACAMARDMVNTPANDMGPRQMESIAREIAENAGATVSTIAGDALLDEAYPAVHAVGRGATSERGARMVEVRWTGPGAEAGPLIAIVGKGVAFDSGGLNIKAGAGMRLMKKDMGGAAHALALARMVMESRLPVRLAVLTPLVENMISGAAIRPGDVIDTRAGLSVEVANTDAEGRLILADALTRAGEMEPDLTLDLATLTGAARVALGPQVVPFYTADDDLAAEMARAAEAVADPLWRMPLWPGYDEAIDSEIAELSNEGAEWAQAGSVIAALFLQRFAPRTGGWIHLDIYAWNPKGRPGWPAGGEAQAIRALYALLKRRYGEPTPGRSA